MKRLFVVDFIKETEQIVVCAESEEEAKKFVVNDVEWKIQYECVASKIIVLEAKEITHPKMLPDDWEADYLAWGDDGSSPLAVSFYREGIDYLDPFGLDLEDGTLEKFADIYFDAEKACIERFNQERAM